MSDSLPSSDISANVFTEPHFPVLPEFRETSYAQRYEIFCKRMVRERHYNAACFLLADRDQFDQIPNYTEPAAELSAVSFLGSLLRHAL
ncbi:MAG: PaeR7I family type II restriction endonuclease [Aphanocapsa lilacina HA4352-LM1]|nr:PaeR7I family type II restriction endonuclease [Aphanocapsa lilacina HA4352-LM1]